MSTLTIHCPTGKVLVPCPFCSSHIPEKDCDDRTDEIMKKLFQYFIPEKGMSRFPGMSDIDIMTAVKDIQSIFFPGDEDD